MKIFIDTNVFLDALLNRDQELSKKVIQYLEKQDIEISLSDISLINIVYIIRKDFSKDEIKEIVNILLKRHEIICANEKIIKNANNSNFLDFEDGVQYFCAKEIDADLIISNNKKDFIESDIFVLRADEFYTLYMKDTI
jgi:predicted nucleic acid-binding protein